jgi:hypothetical protein
VFGNILRGRGKETAMEHYEWMKFYQDAVLETNSDALPFRIAAAQNAIGERVIQVAVDDDERQAIVTTLNALAVLRRERCPAARSAHR